MIYDIENTKSRTRVVRVLESYGIRVQKSAFECWVDSDQLTIMKSKLQTYMDKNDSIRIYDPLNCYDIGAGDNVPLFTAGLMIV